MTHARTTALAAASVLAAAWGCSVDRHAAVDVAMGRAHPPPVQGFDLGLAPRAAPGGGAPLTAAPEPYQLLSGDFHCHVSPPDWNQEANRNRAGTVTLAKEEHLDFVVLTPHVGARFFLDEDARRDELDA